jgi:hypothetical protein
MRDGSASHRGHTTGRIGPDSLRRALSPKQSGVAGMLNAIVGGADKRVWPAAVPNRHRRLRCLIRVPPWWQRTL